MSVRVSGTHPRSSSRNTPHNSAKGSTKFDIPVVQDHREFPHIRRRCITDEQFVKPFVSESVHNFTKRYESSHGNLDIRDEQLRDPSYTRFKVSFDIECKNSYRKAKNKYNQQIVMEIEKMIQFQSNAVDALILRRAMSYTTFWPPYHSENELISTSRNFFKLEPDEKTRLLAIMGNDIC